jgi:acyl carrier protein
VDATTLKDQLRQLIVTALNLTEVNPSDLADQMPLFGEGLGLDSIDALELAVAIERQFQVTIPDEEVGKRAFRNIAALAEFIAARSPR